jgi:predicted phosphoribosyltransferase
VAFLLRNAVPWGARPPAFVSRREAGEALGDALGRYRGTDAIVLGLARGGVVAAAEVAARLDEPLDVLVVRKLGSPGSDELAIGAVTADGERFLNEALIDALGVPEPYVRAVTESQSAEARRLEQALRGDRPAPRVAGRTVILVDDGLATGATMRAAVRSVRRRRPARVVVAAPVGARDCCDALRAEADEVVCLREPPEFGAVGMWYLRFAPVETDEVLACLAQPAAQAT